MNQNMNRRGIGWPASVCLVFAACAVLLIGCISSKTELVKDPGPTSDRSVSRSPTPQAEQYYGLLPPSEASNAIVSARVKSWQHDCEQEKYTFPRFQQGPQYKIMGQGMSVYTLRRTNDTFTASADILGPDGRTSAKGVLIQIRTLSITGEPVESTVLSGVVWTPRATAIGQLDLSGAARISNSPNFNFGSPSRCW